jgi:(2Fe-2S) ferredoxin
MSEQSAINAGFKKMGLESSKRHVFLCVGPDCCQTSEGLATWEVLKAGVKALNIPALRTKAACLRICAGGPWMVIYPEGIWYGRVTPDRCQRILHEHLLHNTPVAEWIERQHPISWDRWRPAGF